MEEFMARFIQAEVPPELHARFENHPLRRGKNQRPFTAEIIEKWLRSPEARLAELEEQIRAQARQLEWMTRRLQQLDALERRVKALEAQLHHNDDTQTVS